jgi:protoporphyrinogen oxidase
VERKVIGQEFDVVCILIKIEETTEVKKEEKLLKKTNFLIADPMKNISLHAVVWNENLVPDNSLIGKAVILSRFKLNEYKSSLTLTSVYKSSIIPVDSHHYQQLEKQAMNEYSSYEKLHEIKSYGIEGEYEVCKSIRELEEKAERLGAD